MSLFPRRWHKVRMDSFPCNFPDCKWVYWHRSELVMTDADRIKSRLALHRITHDVARFVSEVQPAMEKMALVVQEASRAMSAAYQPLISMKPRNFRHKKKLLHRKTKPLTQQHHGKVPTK